MVSLSPSVVSLLPEYDEAMVSACGGVPPEAAGGRAAGRAYVQFDAGPGK